MGEIKLPCDEKSVLGTKDIYVAFETSVHDTLLRKRCKESLKGNNIQINIFQVHTRLLNKWSSLAFVWMINLSENMKCFYQSVTSEIVKNPSINCDMYRTQTKAQNAARLQISTTIDKETLQPSERASQLRGPGFGFNF